MLSCCVCRVCWAIGLLGCSVGVCCVCCAYYICRYGYGYGFSYGSYYYYYYCSVPATNTDTAIATAPILATAPALTLLLLPLLLPLPLPLPIQFSALDHCCCVCFSTTAMAMFTLYLSLRTLQFPAPRRTAYLLFPVAVYIARMTVYLYLTHYPFLHSKTDGLYYCHFHEKHPDDLAFPISPAAIGHSGTTILPLPITPWSLASESNFLFL